MNVQSLGKCFALLLGEKRKGRKKKEEKEEKMENHLVYFPNKIQGNGRLIFIFFPQGRENTTDMREPWERGCQDPCLKFLS